MGHSLYFIVYLEFKVNWVSYVLSGKPIQGPQLHWTSPFFGTDN